MDRVVEVFRERAGYAPDLENPSTLNEKILYRKLHDRRPILTELTDKVNAKKHVDYYEGVRTIPDVDGSQYPFIAKPSNYSGQLALIENDKDWDTYRNRWERLKKTPYGQDKGEWAYKNIEPALLKEVVLRGYREFKFYCFDGRAELVCLLGEREGMGHAESYGTSLFWPNGEQVGKIAKWPQAEKQIPESIDLERMIAVAENLSMKLDFVRVDLLWLQGTIYFTEYTFYPGSGHTRFDPETLDKELGALWTLAI